MKGRRIRNLQMAKQKGLFLMEGVWSRFFPVYDSLRRELKSDVIGDVKHLNINIGLANHRVPRIRFALLVNFLLYSYLPMVLAMTLTTLGCCKE